ncbi:protein kinase [Kineosporia sp. J2-2]|uniref:Protein kinase n=1 Tax=Kineosporia corallincola TaxID=2835133 RepID=A0ABS5TTL5_9ACTN|nr:protein kinase [Kineosporia corallincola]MBT0774153.1 protein kinase [Kineosporia corallincola]
MDLHPLHPAAWVLHQLSQDGWQVDKLLTFTRASTLALAHRKDSETVVIKAGFGSNHVLAELDAEQRASAYGFYWYAQLTENERALSRDAFREEADLTEEASALAHMVPLLDRGTSAKFDWYTMPWLSGGNFREHMLVQPPSAQGLWILADVAEALSHLHEIGIVHRDVYQENILIHEGRGHLTDLGAARRLTTPRGPERRQPEVHWPPEYLDDYRNATTAADIFSLGVLIYRYLCGDIPRLDADHERLPVALRNVVAAALARHPRQRPSAGELVDALRAPRS